MSQKGQSHIFSAASETTAMQGAVGSGQWAVGRGVDVFSPVYSVQYYPTSL